jgi:DNA processing protein
MADSRAVEGRSCPYGEHLHAHLALARVSFLRTGEKRMLLDVFDNLAQLFSLSKEHLESLLGRRVVRAEWEPSRYLREAEEDIEILERGTIDVLLFFDKAYPPQLRELVDAPILLFYRGRLPDPTKPLVGIVGTRHPTGAGRSAAFRLGWELASCGLGIVSGLARGIDSEAHRGCLRGSAPAVAVLGNGLNSVYPRSSASLGREIIERGGVLFSEYPPSAQPCKYYFPARNRIISGLSRSVVVVQAPERSGALITAEYALDQGRDLFVHRTGASGTASKGSAELVHDGAEVIETGRDILEHWQWIKPRASESIGRSDSERDAFSKRKASITGQGTGRRLAELLEKELGDRLSFHNGGYQERAT